MKKFMTVLLVIAVMFTFSFGSAFAAFSADAVPDTISDGYFESLWTEYVKADKTYETFVIEKAVLAGMKAEAKVVYDDYMKNVAAGYVTTDGAFADIFADANTRSAAKAYRLAAAAAQFAADKDAALAKFATVPTYNYSAEEISAAVESKVESIAVGKVADELSYKEAAELLVAYHTAKIADQDDFDADVTVADYKAASEAVKAEAYNYLFAMAYKVGAEVSLTGSYDLAAAYKTYATTGTGVRYVDQDTVNYWGTEAIAADKQVGAAGVAAQKASNAAEYAAFVVGKDAATVKAAAKWLKIADILAEEGVAATDIDVALNDYADKADDIAELEAYAAKWGAEKNAEGELIRDAAKVAEIVEEGIVEIAKGTANALKDAKAAIDAAVTAKIADQLAFVKESAVKAAELFLADVEEDYYAAEFAKVEAKVAEYVAKIEAADEEADVKALIKEMHTKVDAIKTYGEVDTQFASTVSDLKTYADNYVTYYNNNQSTEGAKLHDSKLLARLTTMVGESGLRTVTEIKKLTEEAIAVAQGLPTNNEVAAAKKAVKAAVEAIPTKVTVEDQALVQAAVDAQKAYAKLTTAASEQETAIANKVTALVSAYNTSFVKAAATVDEADEAAVKALKSEINAVVKALEKMGATAGELNYLNGLVKTLNDYLDDIQEAEYDAIVDAIKAIPVNVTEADKAVVEKARELVDAYEAKYTDYTALYYQDNATMGDTDYYAGYAALYFAALTEAETVLGLNAPEEVDPAYSVEALKITAKSSAKKGSITVKWTVEGDTDAVEGYEIWKSTKKNSGFKKAFTATKMSYKNTKGLKKGTRYFYKVRAIAYTAEGEKVKSDWSNKAYRVAK